jgi:two-component system CheB/CheR fusion protein
VSRADASTRERVPAAADDADLLLSAARDLSAAHDVGRVMQIVRLAARALTGADGVTFVLREGAHCHYADEDAIAPLWKGQRFLLETCISGWAMLHRESVVIEDVFADPRIPHGAYRATFVRSLAMVPVGSGEPVAAIGAYWARRHRATLREVGLVESLAGLASVALANTALWADLRRAVDARDEFLAIASHELRTPITPIALEVDRARRLLDRGGDPELLRSALSRVERSAARLAQLVDDMLDVSRVERGRLVLERSELDLAAVVGAVVERLRPADSARVVIRAPAPVRGRWDAARLGHVVEGLVSNALKFGASGPVELDVRADEPDGPACLEVRDHGPGIPPEDQARIFERFERAVSVHHFGGFGLGLWLARAVVEAHGGTVSVASRPGEGATFTVRLPREAPAADAAEAGAPGGSGRVAG